MQIAEAYRLQARILYLSSLTPRFLNASDGKHRFSPVLFDFRYFTDTAAAEARVDSSRHLQSLEEEMREVSSAAVMCLATRLATVSAPVGLWSLPYKAVEPIRPHCALTSASFGAPQQITTGNTPTHDIDQLQYMHLNTSSTLGP